MEVREVESKNTTQRCCRCGYLPPEVKRRIDLSVRTYECSNCGLKGLDRDYNAALNILRLGLEQALAEREPILVSNNNIERTSKLLSMKQEAYGLIRR